MKSFYIKSEEEVFILEADEIYLDDDGFLEVIRNKETIAQFHTWDFWYEYENPKE